MGYFEPYVKLYYLELKEEFATPETYAGPSYYLGFTEYLTSDLEQTRLTENFNDAGFYLSPEAADYVNAHVGNQFYVREHKIEKNVWVKPEPPTTNKKHKLRIIEQTAPDGTVKYLIQRKKLWWWFTCGNTYTTETYQTYEEAEKNLCWWDGTGYKERTVFPT